MSKMFIAGDMSKEFIQKLKYFIAEINKKHEIKMAYLFGSFARGQTSEHSDIDIALRFQDEYSSLEDIKIRGALMELGKEVLKREVDIINLDKVPIRLKYVVVHQGILLKDNDERASFESLVLREYFDYAYYAEKYNTAILESIKDDEFWEDDNG